MRYLFASILFLLLTHAHAQLGQPILVTDMLKIKTATGVTLTDDGTVAAYVVTSIEPESDSAKWEYKYTSQLWIVSTEPGAKPRQITFSKEGASQPAWSPDGKQLAFVRNVEGRPQIFILSFTGGE